jgi:arginine deiminase
MALMSETGRLRRVLVHEPGAEVEEMTPSTAQELLYNDIVPVESVRREHRELHQVLRVFAEVVEVSAVLEDIAAKPTGTAILSAALSCNDPVSRDRLLERWHTASPRSIRDDCILGVTRDSIRLKDVYAVNRYLTPPLPNLYFTRDSAFVVHDRAYRSAMAGRVREAEAAIMAEVLSALGETVDSELAAGARLDGSVRLEGGDVLILDENTLVIGVGERTSPEGVDALIESLVAGRDTPLTVVAVDLPRSRATIHLDMIATFIGPGELLGYAPLLTGSQARKAFTITAPPGYGTSWTIREHESLPAALADIGRPHTIIPCGGKRTITQEREQWFSACNSVAVGPQTVVVYKNNPRTLEVLNDSGYAVVTGGEVLERPGDFCSVDGQIRSGPTAIAVEGVELARGGGGPRCMTLPIEREPV